jgi:hypothetical protein
MQTDQLENRESAPAGAEDWQASCRDLAKSRKPFAVQGFNADHWQFFEELRHDYHYELRPVMSKIIFVPLDSDDPASD